MDAVVLVRGIFSRRFTTKVVVIGWTRYWCLPAPSSHNIYSTHFTALVGREAIVASSAPSEFSV